MLRNYLKIAWRNIRKRAQTSIIAISSLSIGLAVCFVIGLYVLHEISYDRFVPDSDRITRVIMKMKSGYLAESFPGVAQTLETKLSGVESLTEIRDYGDLLITKDNESFRVENVLMADSSMTKIFPTTTLSGNVEAALNQPNAIVLSQTTAQRLFGDQNAIGEVLTVELVPGYSFDYKVGAVVQDPPTNLHFDYKAILSLSHQGERQGRFSNTIEWGATQGYVYVKLNEGVDVASFQQRMSSLEKQLDKPESWQGEMRFKAQPLTDIHFGQDIGNEIAPQGDIRYLFIFSAIGILILGIACFNYMNLTTARTLPRAGEVGMRKVLGATRSNLIFQFLAEAVLTSLIAFPIAIGLTELALPIVQEFIGEEFAFSLFSYPQLLLVALAVVISAGLLSGLYPAFVISSFRPATIFRSWSKSGSSSSALQKSLLVVQFAIAVLFLISTIAINRQLNFIHDKKLGFDKEQIVYFDTSPLQDQYDAFKQKLASNASVVSITKGTPPGIGWRTMSTTITDSAGTEKRLNFMQVDYGFVETMGITLKEGRAFSQSFGTDKKNGVIINESAADFFDLREKVVGSTVKVSGKEMEVIGLVEDFHNESLKAKIQPVALLNDMSPLTGGRVTVRNSIALVRLAPGNVQHGISDIEQAWASFLPGRPLDFTFLDEEIEAQYRTEQRQATLMSAFAGIAILIACIGLLGLAALMTQNRTKEIGIRKVLGATVTNIVQLLSKDFLKLVALGFIIAVPIAWYAMNRWLADFAYKIEIGPGIFLLAGGLALLIALATVSWQSIRAALANPVESLRSE